MDKRQKLIMLIFFVLVIVIWHGIVELCNIPHILVPLPLEVAKAFALHYRAIFYHTLMTTIEALSGCLLAIMLAFVVAMVVVLSKSIEKMIIPIIVVLNAYPIVVIAPLLAVYVGPGLIHKIIISYLICFLPILMSLIKGLGNIDPQLRKYLRVIKANRISVLFRIRIPQALPYLFVGLRIGVPLCFLGAVVGELVVPSFGLGYLVGLADNQFLIDYQYAVIIWMGAVSYFFYKVVVWLERKVVYWR